MRYHHRHADGLSAYLREDNTEIVMAQLAIAVFIKIGKRFTQHVDISHGPERRRAEAEEVRK